MGISEKTVEELKKTLEATLIEKEHEKEFYFFNLNNLSIKERKEKGLCLYPVQVTSLKYGLGQSPIVDIEINEKNETGSFSSGSVIELFCNQSEKDSQKVRGIIHRKHKERVQLKLYSNEHPDWIKEGKIGINAAFDERTFQEMERAFRTVFSMENKNFNHNLSVLYGEKKNSKTNSHSISLPHFNTSQLKAINFCIQTDDVAIIHGPPGTGKTTTLIGAIEQLIKKGEKILISTPSNTAADLITEQLAEKNINVSRIGNTSRIDESLLKHTIEGKLENHPEQKLLKELKKKANEFRDMAGKYKRKFGKEEAYQRKLLYKEAHQIKKDVEALEKNMIDVIATKSEVITCTLVGASSFYISQMDFDTVIIDEAAQGLEPATFIPLLKGKKWILAGDPYQLPPTIMSSEAEGKGLNITLMEKGIQRTNFPCLLDTQYRMHELIMAFSNNEFYQGQLKAHESVKDRGLKNEKKSPISFVDTAGCGFEEVKLEGKKSLSNPEEFSILMKHLSETITTNDDIQTIGIISPYKRQVLYMKENYDSENDLGKNNSKTRISTIDGFQGQECDVIYISLVRSNQKNEIGFLKDYRRLNVAITRAKKKLVLVGDSATLSSNPMYKRMIEFIEQFGGYQSAWEYMK